MQITDTSKKAIDIYYDKLESLINSVITEYEQNFERENIAELDNYIAVLNDSLDTVQDKRATGEFYSELEVIFGIFNKLNDEYPAILKEAIHYFKIIFALFSKISRLDISVVPLIPLIDEDMFKLIPFDTSFEEFYFSPADIRKAIIVFSLSDLSGINDFLNKFNVELLFHLLDKLDFTNENSGTQKYLLIAKDSLDNPDSLKSFMNLYEVSVGKEIHNAYSYEQTPSIRSDVEWDYSKGYQQFDDTIYILSEYNYQKNIIDKYLKLYQVIENFMFREPICSLVNLSGDVMFSIRDFQNLYKRVMENEMNALKKFMKLALTLNYKETESIKFKDIVYLNWGNLINTPDKTAEINGFLRKLGYKENYSETVNLGNIQDFFSEVVYKLRNCIVHNKETEFHLTYGNFSEYPAIARLLEDFLIVCLEELTFNMLINKSQLISYNYPHIKLFR
ncbi:hypothetical protein CXK86_00850 [Paenibacillus sp. BGI2013]|uniref:hypothetical protein n=1 Tax=Paenibacillus sp. BGI2013 TaxID=2058902 RepID=UPI000C6E3472|nr:hypothetical protein [Paenibacillus sp. BGI2013]PKQ92700.1 hypothetical protein CXK86_00850 [Paenibacillus sp. BGI2013]